MDLLKFFRRRKQAASNAPVVDDNLALAPAGAIDVEEDEATPRLATAGGAVPPAGRHRSVIDADPYSFAVAHRRLAWMFRISAMTNVGLLVTVVVLVNLIVEMLPLKETEFVFLREHPADSRIYRVEPVSRNVRGFDVMMEGMAKRYVAECLAVDSVSQSERTRWCARTSETKYWERFTKEHRDRVDEMNRSGITRSIVIESADRLQTAAGTYKYAVDFIQIDKQGGREIERQKLRAYLNLTQRPQQVTETDKYENPHGITVLDLAVRRRANS